MPDPDVPSDHRQLQSRRFVIAGSLAGAALLAILASTHSFGPVLIWNASPSSPTGLYVVTRSSRLQVGDMIVAWPPAAAGALAARRGYLPSNIPLVKTVAAIADDRVCASDGALSVNGRVLVRRLSIDRAGRALPGWSGCRTLLAHELLLLGLSDPGSFDSRYFGPVGMDRVLGRATLMWPV